MQLPPASVISSWPLSNFVNPETRGPAGIVIVSVLLALVTILLVIRVYSRVWISKGFGLDDVLILVAYIPTAAFAIVSFVAQIDFDLGRHVWDLPLEDITPNLQLSLSSQLLFDLSTNLTKLSMLSLIYRLASVDERSRYGYFVIFVAAFVTLDCIIFFFITTFQCSPPEAYWTLSATPQACVNEVKHLLAAGCINTTTDFIILLVPIPYVRRLKLPREQQIVVGGLFAGGIFVTAAGAARTVVTFLAFSDPKGDITWNAIPVTIASALELFVGIICASVPATKPFFARYVPRLIGNPINWVSQQSRSRTSAKTTAVSSSTKNAPDADFWLVTKRDSGIESPPLVMQMRNRPPMPGMPTPTRPPRTPSTMRPLLQQDDPASLASTAPPGSPSSNIVTDTARLRTSPNLDKPLPVIRNSSWLERMSVPQQAGRKGSSTNMTSIYQFVPHDDGHISVYKTKSNHGK